MKIRCFIAIKFPEEVIKEVERIQNILKKQKMFFGKFTELKNLHLTLKFLGEIDEKKFEEIKKLLGEVKFKRSEASLGGLGVFSENLIRIVWIKIFKLNELQKIIDEKMRNAGFDKEKSFMSHLTIARVKTLKDKKLFLENLEKIKVNDTVFKVKEFYLIQSILKKSALEYKMIEKFELD